LLLRQEAHIAPNGRSCVATSGEARDP